MTETTEVARLDYSKPPPGYRIDEQDGEFDWYVGDDVSPDNGNASLITTEADALREAWEDYKAEHDPPGLDVGEIEEEAPENDGWCFTVGCDSWSADWDEAEARTAAWAWHDRRHALAANGLQWLWPACLTWTDDQVAEVEHWLADSTAEMPEALRA
jgi:hypothetical protein